MVFWFLSLVIIEIGDWTDKFRFGLGLGDMIYSAIIIIALLIGGIYYLTDFYKSPSPLLSKHNLIVLALCFVFLVFIVLKMTLLRGGESSWDGRIIF